MIRRRWSTVLRWSLLVGLPGAAAIELAYSAESWWQPSDRSRSVVDLDDPSASTLAVPNINRPLDAAEALRANAERPIEAANDKPAARFLAGSAGKDDLARALDCLTQAVYYEAGSEPIDGERAVAQVVLNRVRHPGFPSSVCGTVYQGSERVTGCQFTFTCDGSLRRIPDRAGWARARKVATDALIKGQVFAPVGHSTHYHADYVVPYWAASLAKEVQIGAHIFYRLPGSLGSAGAFSQRYARKEPLPPSPTASEVVADAVNEAMAETNPLTPPDPLAGAAGDPVGLPDVGPLKADEERGTLILGEQAAAPALSKPLAPSDCKPVGLPAGPRIEDGRAQAPKPSIC